MSIFTNQHVKKVARTLASDGNLQQATIGLFARMFHEDNPQFNSYVFEKRIRKIQSGDVIDD